MRTCKVCGVKKKLKDFYSWYDKRRNKVRYQTICKACKSIAYYTKEDPAGEDWVAQNVPRRREV